MNSFFFIDFSKVMAEKYERVRENDYSVIACLLVLALMYVRECEAFPGAVSLRDVRRVLQLINFFLSVAKFESQMEREEKTPRIPKKKSSKRRGLVSAVSISLAFVFLFRLSNHTHRAGFWAALCAENSIVHTFVLFFFMTFHFL